MNTINIILLHEDIQFSTGNATSPATSTDAAASSMEDPSEPRVLRTRREQTTHEAALLEEL